MSHNKYTKWDDLTKNDVLLILKNFYEEFGHLKHDHYKKLVGERGLPSITSIFRIFNTKRWIDIVNLLDIEDLKRTPNSKITYLKAYGIEKLKEYYNYCNSIPSVQDFKNNKWKPSYIWYARNFGNMRNACLEAGVISLEDYNNKTTRIIKKNTSSQLIINKSERIEITINEIKRISDLLGRYPIKKEYDANIIDGSYHYSSINKIFKMPFHDFCRLYAPGYIFIKNDFPKSMSFQERKNILINEIKEVSFKIGRTPIQSELTKLGLHDLNTYMKYFDKTYNEILNELGLELNKRTLEQTDEELLNDFYNVFIKLGHIPIGQEYINNNLEGKWNYTNRFSSIKNVCDLLNIDFNKYYKPNSAGVTCLDNNGDLCRSIIEKDITNFFIVNKLFYIKEYSYGNLIKGERKKFDWKVIINNKEYYIEYAGMYSDSPNHSISRRYSNKIKNKIDILTKNNYIDKCIFIYPDNIKNNSLKEIFDKLFGLNLINVEYSKYTDIKKYDDLSDEELYDLFIKYYEVDNDLTSKGLINYNYSLYAEFKRRYGSHYNFLIKYNLNPLQKYKGYWDYNNIINTFLHMINTYNDILTTPICQEISKTDNKLKGFTTATIKFGGYKKMQLEFYNYCNNNNINLQEHIINKIFHRNKEAV